MQKMKLIGTHVTIINCCTLYENTQQFKGKTVKQAQKKKCSNGFFEIINPKLIQELEKWSSQRASNLDPVKYEHLKPERSVFFDGSFNWMRNHPSLLAKCVVSPNMHLKTLVV